MNDKAKPPTYFYKLFRVKLSDGRVTTVSLDPKLLTRAEVPMGGARPLNAWVRQTALSYTSDQSVGPSAFVADLLRAELDKFAPTSDSRATDEKQASEKLKSKTPKLAPTDEFTREFHHLLGRLAHAHASLDFNVGLQLNWLGPYLQVKVHHLLDAKKVAFAKRLDMLKQLVFELFENAGDAALGEFQQWFEAADAMKALRNDYVHGRWGVPGKLVDGQPMLAFVPLHWDMTPDRPDDSIYLTLDDFGVQVAKMETLAHEYFRLERKHLAHGKPASQVG
jgi:hypothetical protein